MHIHCRFLPLLVAGAILAQDLPTGLLQAQTVTATRWVISALHPDPTPALGAPDCEYIALHALPDSQPGGGTCRTDGLVLSWNGHERELPDGAWPVGSTVVVHRAADSLLLTDWAPHRIGLSSWPALVNGGTLVSLSDSGGLQVTKETHPDPSNWQVWVEGGRSLVVPTGGVMAFGRCPRWFRRGHPEAGPACWPAESWFSLSDEAGSLSLRLPSHGPEPIDSISWHAGMQGPWWWQETGWAWRRMGPGPEDWSPSTDGGSPGAINRAEPVDCPGQHAPVSVVVGVNGLPALRWRFPSAGHSVLLRMVRWPDGTLVNMQGLDLSERQGEWTWTGEDSSGNPVPPGGLVWDVRWWGRTCRGRFREHLRVPGRP